MGANRGKKKGRYEESHIAPDGTPRAAGALESAAVLAAMRAAKKEALRFYDVSHLIVWALGGPSHPSWLSPKTKLPRPAYDKVVVVLVTGLTDALMREHAEAFGPLREGLLQQHPAVPLSAPGSNFVVWAAMDVLMRVERSACPQIVDTLAGRRRSADLRKAAAAASQARSESAPPATGSVLPAQAPAATATASLCQQPAGAGQLHTEGHQGTSRESTEQPAPAETAAAPDTDHPAMMAAAPEVASILGLSASQFEERIAPLLMSREDMRDNGFVAPGDPSCGVYAQTVPRPEGADPLPPERRMVAIDTESCHTDSGLQLARVTLVDSCSRVIYDELVVPQSAVVDHLTWVSGVSGADLSRATRTFDEARGDVMRLVPSDAVLVGHGLENDLSALRLSHGRLVDTSVLYRNARGGKSRLRDAVKECFGEDIQAGSHDSAVDAICSLRLVMHRLSHAGAASVHVEPRVAGEEVPEQKELLLRALEEMGVRSVYCDSCYNVGRFCAGCSDRSVVRLPVSTDGVSVPAVLRELAGSDARLLMLRLNALDIPLRHDVREEGEEKEHRTTGHSPEVVEACCRSVVASIQRVHEAVQKGSLLILVGGGGHNNKSEFERRKTMQSLMRWTTADDDKLKSYTLEARTTSAWFISK
eukprot:m51a1_g2385 putative exonuclease family protein (647) ;mRNA; f:709541-711821